MGRRRRRRRTTANADGFARALVLASGWNEREGPLLDGREGTDRYGVLCERINFGPVTKLSSRISPLIYGHTNGLSTGHLALMHNIISS